MKLRAFSIWMVLVGSCTSGGLYFLSWQWWLVVLSATSSITFCAYGVDKVCAIKGMSRISERALLSMALCLGSVGALGGMYVFRHKVSKPSFYKWVYLWCALHLAGCAGVWFAINRELFLR